MQNFVDVPEHKMQKIGMLDKEIEFLTFTINSNQYNAFENDLCEDKKTKREMKDLTETYDNAIQPKPDPNLNIQREKQKYTSITRLSKPLFSQYGCTDREHRNIQHKNRVVPKL
jgi:hypothetical protein